ncbi:MAG: class B sortase [Lachnospiraceae bacterium]|nr:class B sortase [Lachnospiraceae bacterium]
MRNVKEKAAMLVLLALAIAIICVAVKIYTEVRRIGAAEQGAQENTEDASLHHGQGFAGESAEDGVVDFSMLKEKNSDIFAWIHIPGTSVDCPILQSEQSDTFYEEHNAYGEDDDAGAVYTELANLTSMCDFNTVLHGKTGADGNGLFADLYRFADPQFFEEHETVRVYLDGNVLTYEIFAAYERENTSLIRTYDFTYLSGCQEFLNDLYGTRDMGMNLREGWENVNAYNYVITLTTQKEENPDSQFVVVAVLVEDAAGTIERVVTE